ncbi:MAG: hypothetical protein JXB88_05345 [Spirochaetales bacterium]|nr:hypothetical protein [Spirochaetales bacterium]
MNIENSGSMTEQYTILPLSREISGNPVTDFQAENILKRAKAMALLRDKTGVQATNLIRMAETALKNGNPVSARNFAQKVVQMLIPDNVGNSLKKEIQLPEPVQPAQVRPEKKKHTEHTYQDASNDPGVSFTYPGNLTGPESFLAVPAHEYEHVRRSLQEAILNGEPVRVYVSYRVRYDPATGEPYMAGGVTRTIRLPDIPAPDKGKVVDTYA